MDIRPWPEVVATLPAMTEEERERLRASIAEHGVKYPVLVLPDGRIIDGVHRWEVTGGTAPVEVLEMDEDAAFALAVSLKIDRAHMTKDEIKAAWAAKREAAARLVDGGMLLKQAAAVVGVAPTVVSKWEKHRRSIKVPGHPGDAVPDAVRRKIAVADRLEIVDRHDAGETQAALAEEYGVVPSAISALIRKERGRRAQEDVDSASVGVAAAPLIDFRERAEQRDGPPTRIAPPRKEPDRAVVVRETRAWLKQAQRATYDLRNLWSRFDAALGDGVEGEVLAHELDAMAEEYRSFAESIRRGTAERRSRGHGRTAG